jgi:hypothetical protein
MIGKASKVFILSSSMNFQGAGFRPSPVTDTFAAAFDQVWGLEFWTIHGA